MAAHTGDTAARRTVDVETVPETVVVDTYSVREPVRKGIPLLMGAVGVPLLGLWALVPVRHGVEDALRGKAIAVLAANNVAGVEVTMNGRDARLAGSVASEAERRRIHDLVRTRVGVRHVDESRLTVGGAAGDGPGDGALDIALTGGRITITGTVSDDPTRSSLVTGLGAIVGADHVDDQLVVDATLGSVASVDTLNEAGLKKLRALIDKVATLRANGVHVLWDNGNVHLRGSVATDAIKADLHDEATKLFGTDAVIDELVVDPGAAAAADVTTSLPALDGGTTPSTIAIDTSAAPDAAGASSTNATEVTTAPETTAPETTAPETTAPAPATTEAGPTTTLGAAAAAVQEDINAVLATNAVEFDTGNADLSPAGKATVTKLASALAKQVNVKVAIEGYTDNVGGAPRNLALSQARAETVRKALVAEGTDNSRLAAKGYGPARPIADNATAEGRRKNRRIEFKVSGG